MTDPAVLVDEVATALESFPGEVTVKASDDGELTLIVENGPAFVLWLSDTTGDLVCLTCSQPENTERTQHDEAGNPTGAVPVHGENWRLNQHTFVPARLIPGKGEAED